MNNNNNDNKNDDNSEKFKTNLLNNNNKNQIHLKFKKNSIDIIQIDDNNNNNEPKKLNSKPKKNSINNNIIDPIKNFIKSVNIYNNLNKTVLPDLHSSRIGLKKIYLDNDFENIKSYSNIKVNVPDINKKLNGSQLFINHYENDFNLYIYIYICYIWIFLLYYI